MKKLIFALSACLGLAGVAAPAASAQPYTRTVVRGVPNTADQAFETIYADSAHSWSMHLYVKSCPDNSGPETHYFMVYVRRVGKQHNRVELETWPTNGHFRLFERIPKGNFEIHVQGGCNWTLTAPRRAHLLQIG